MFLHTDRCSFISEGLNEGVICRYSTQVDQCLAEGWCSLKNGFGLVHSFFHIFGIHIWTAYTQSLFSRHSKGFISRSIFREGSFFDTDGNDVARMRPCNWKFDVSPKEDASAVVMGPIAIDRFVVLSYIPSRCQRLSRLHLRSLSLLTTRYSALFVLFFFCVFLTRESAPVFRSSV